MSQHERRSVNPGELGSPIRFEIETDRGWIIRFLGEEAAVHAAAIDQACSIATALRFPTILPEVFRCPASNASSCSSPVHWFAVDVPADGDERCACCEETLSANFTASAKQWEESLRAARTRIEDLESQIAEAMGGRV